MALAAMLALVGGEGAAAVAAPAAQPGPREVDAADSPFITELLRRTEEKREQRKKERLDDYYRRNFKDYMEFEAGDAKTGAARGVKSETQRAISEWLDANK